MKPATHTFGGGIDQTAIIGHAPEGREWKPGDPTYAPNVDHRARIEAYVTIDAGMRRHTIIMQRVWLMKHVHIGHDAVVWQDAEIAPGAVICGHAVIGAGVHIGVNASVLPYVRVGAGARIGAGAVVTADVPPVTTYAGNPARELVSSRPKGASAPLLGRDTYRSSRRDGIARRISLSHADAVQQIEAWNDGAAVIPDAAYKHRAREGLTSKEERGHWDCKNCGSDNIPGRRSCVMCCTPRYINTG